MIVPIYAFLLVPATYRHFRRYINFSSQLLRWCLFPKFRDAAINMPRSLGVSQVRNKENQNGHKQTDGGWWLIPYSTDLCIWLRRLQRIIFPSLTSFTWNPLIRTDLLRKWIRSSVWCGQYFIKLFWVLGGQRVYQILARWAWIKMGGYGKENILGMSSDKISENIKTSSGNIWYSGRILCAIRLSER